MLQAYFDDSGTHDSSDVVVWAGFIGTADQWRTLSEEWTAQLRRPFPDKPPLRNFHLTECEAGQGAFGDYSRAERDRIQWLFRDIIVRAGVIGLGYAVSCAAYSRLAVEERERMGSPEAACVSGCIIGADQAVRDHYGEPAPLTLNFDRGRASAMRLMASGEITIGLGQLQSITDLTFQTVGECPPLQAADILATEHRWHVQGRIRGEREARPHFASFLQRTRSYGFQRNGLAADQTTAARLT